MPHILVKTKDVSFFFYLTIKLLSINRRSLFQTVKSSYKQTPITSLGVTCNNYDSSFSKFLEMSNKSTIRIKNMKVLMIERFKFLNDLSPPTMNGIFQKQEKNYCSLRNTRSLVSKRKFTTTYGIDTISFRGPQIWKDLPKF